MAKGTGTVNKNGIVEEYMRGNGTTMKKKDKEHISTRMEIIIKVSGRKICKMVMASILIQTEV